MTTNLTSPKPVDEKLQEFLDKALYAGGSPTAQQGPAIQPRPVILLFFVS